MHAFSSPLAVLRGNGNAKSGLERGPCIRQWRTDAASRRHSLNPCPGTQVRLTRTPTGRQAPERHRKHSTRRAGLHSPRNRAEWLISPRHRKHPDQDRCQSDSPAFAGDSGDEQLSRMLDRMKRFNRIARRREPPSTVRTSHRSIRREAAGRAAVRWHRIAIRLAPEYLRIRGWRGRTARQPGQVRKEAAVTMPVRAVRQPRSPFRPLLRGRGRPAVPPNHSDSGIRAGQFPNARICGSVKRRETLGAAGQPPFPVKTKTAIGSSSGIGTCAASCVPRGSPQGCRFRISGSAESSAALPMSSIPHARDPALPVSLSRSDSAGPSGTLGKPFSGS